MANTPEIRVTSADALVAYGSTASALTVSSAGVLAALNFPTPFERVSSLGGLVSVKFGMDLRVSEAGVLVAVRGRTANPKIRAFTFSLDGHDFYVLRIGMDVTLVYDLYSEEWVDWDAFGEKYWPVNVGINWVGGTGLAGLYGSNVIVGDDTYGLIYFLDPKQPYDQNPELDDPQIQIYFERIIMGQMPISGREVLPCYAVWLTTDMGAPAYVGAGVQLLISDDGGQSYDDMGTVTVTVGETSPELSWYSLGQIGAPGRLFKFIDDGAIARIDSMEMNDPDDAK